MRESVIKVSLGMAHSKINMRDKTRSETKTLRYYTETIGVYDGMARYFVSILNTNIKIYTKHKLGDGNRYSPLSNML